MRGKLPESVLKRKKTGFDIPTHDWFRGTLRRLLMDTLTPEAIAATGIFDARAIEALIRDHMERRINVGYHLWGLLTLFLWMKRWKVEVLPPAEAARPAKARRLRYQLIVVLVAALIFLGCIISPPSLMDDVDAVQAQIARNMLESGDWVTARLDGVAYLEKSPLKYWMIAVSFAIFGVHDWAARIPIALATVLLCWVTARFAAWAFGRRAGLYAGLVLATSIGLFLFTRILIPDVMLTLTITIALWGMLRALEEEERHPAAWAMAMWAAIGTGLLLKGLIAAAFPVATGLLYLALTQQLLVARTWRRLQVICGDAAGAGDRGAVARAGDAAQSAVLRFHDAQRDGLVSRLLLVLLHQRARAAVSEPAVSARLQHGAAGCISGCSICCGSFPGACIFRRRCELKLPAARTGRRGCGCCACAGPASS